jgi:CubicO group peptidase (beta-lactamase class C family)
VFNIYQFEQQIMAQMKARQIPGLSLAIVYGEEICYAQGFGVTSCEDGAVPITPHTLFRLGSTTKLLTATAILRLVEAGKLDLDTPVREYIPWLMLSNPKAAERINLRMLLTHTAGLSPYDNTFRPRGSEGLEQFVREKLSHAPITAPPGQVFCYSDTHFILAGFIAEVVTGKRYAELMHEWVFAPLKMKHTMFDPTLAMTYPLSQSHYLLADGSPCVVRPLTESAAEYPAGSAFSTVMDMANLAIAHMNCGRFEECQFLTLNMLSQMHHPHVAIEPFHIDSDETVHQTNYGLGIGVDFARGLRWVGHGGGIDGFVSDWRIALEPRVAVIAQWNAVGTEDFSIEEHPLVDFIFDRLFEEFPPQTEVTATSMQKSEPISPDVALWSPYMGAYLGPFNGLATLTRKEARLTLDWNGRLITLEAYRSDLYVGDDHEVVRFLPSEEGFARYIVVDGYPCCRLDCEPELVRFSQLWEDYVGRYEGPAARFTVRLAGEQLYIYSDHDKEEVVCIALGESIFANKLGVFEFMRNANGVVSALKWAMSVTYVRL